MSNLVKAFLYEDVPDLDGKIQWLRGCLTLNSTEGLEDLTCEFSLVADGESDPGFQMRRTPHLKAGDSSVSFHLSRRLGGVLPAEKRVRVVCRYRLEGEIHQEEHWAISTNLDAHWPSTHHVLPEPAKSFVQAWEPRLKDFAEKVGAKFWSHSVHECSTLAGYTLGCELEQHLGPTLKLEIRFSDLHGEPKFGRTGFFKDNGVATVARWRRYNQPVNEESLAQFEAIIPNLMKRFDQILAHGYIPQDLSVYKQFESLEIADEYQEATGNESDYTIWKALFSSGAVDVTNEQLVLIHPSTFFIENYEEYREAYNAAKLARLNGITAELLEKERALNQKGLIHPADFQPFPAECVRATWPGRWTNLWGGFDVRLLFRLYPHFQGIYFFTRPAVSDDGLTASGRIMVISADRDCQSIHLTFQKVDGDWQVLDRLVERELMAEVMEANPRKPSRVGTVAK